MGGLFGFFDYSKPGKGVAKDETQKARIFVFFEVFFRKFWNLIKVNMLFSIFNIPALFVAVFVTEFFFRQPFSNQPMVELTYRILTGCMFLSIPLITVGPAQAGLNYVLKNYSNEEHSFIWWDFKDSALSNLKQSIIISLIDTVITVFFGISINLYNYLSVAYHFLIILIPVVLLTFIIFVIMHLYMYPMLVTYELSIKQIYKNAFLFSISKLLPNLGILLICYAVVFLSFYNPILGLILFPIITVSTIGLIINFFVNPIMKKYMINDDEDENGEKELIE